MTCLFRKFRLRAFVSLALSPAWFSPHVFAQISHSASAAESTSVASSPSPAPRMEIPRHHVETTIALGAAGQLTATRLQESTTELFTQSLSPSIGLFFTFRQSFKPWLGYSVNFGYTRAMFRQTSSPPLSTGGRTYESYVPNHLYETSVSYIAQRHLTKRVTVFGEAGAGAVTFSLNNHEFRYSPDPAVYIGRSDTYRPEGIAGVGIDYHLTHGLGLRAGYRGQFFKYPDYGSGGTRLKTFSSQPSLSVTYTFGKRPR